MSNLSRRVWLGCGVAGGVLYIAMVALIPALWPDYSSFSQTISELSAFDAPTRTVWVLFGAVYTLLVLGFGVGILKVAGRDRLLRTVGALFIASGAMSTVWPPMHSRAVIAAGGGTTSDTLHLVWAAVTVLLMFGQIGFGAAALGGRFRLYSIGTMIVLAIGGVLTFLGAPGLSANAPTPWLGVWERINVLGFMVWQAALSIALMRFTSRRSAAASGAGSFASSMPARP